MATAHRRAFGTLLLVVVLAAACMPAARPETLAPVVAPAVTSAVPSAVPSAATEEDIPALIDQLCGYDWIAADRAGEMLAGIGAAAASALADGLPAAERLACRPMLVRALAAMPDVAKDVLQDRLARGPAQNSLTRALYAIALQQMGQPGLEAIAAAAESGETDERGKAVALGAMPLLGSSAGERLAAIAVQSAATDGERKTALNGLIWLGEDTLAAQKQVFARLPAVEQAAFLTSLASPSSLSLYRQATPLLLAVVSDQVSGEAVTDTVKLAAINVLSTTRSEPARVVPVLTTAAVSDSLPSALRTAAIDALGSYATAAQPALAALQTMLNDDDQQRLHPVLIGAIGRIGAGDPAVLDALLAREPVCDTPQSAAATASAAQVLGSMGMLAQFTLDDTQQPQQARVLGALQAMLNCDSEEVKLAAIEALGRQGAHALPALHRAFRVVNSPQLEQQLSSALAAVGADAVPALVFQLVRQNASHSTWRIAGEAIKQIGAPALPALVQALHAANNRPSRGRLLNTLYAIGPDAFVVLMDLAQQGEIRPDLERLNTIFMTVTASDLGVASPAVLPVLIGASSPLTEPTDDNKQAVLLIGLIGPPAAPAASALAALLREEGDPQFQCRIAEAIQNIGPEAGVAAPALADALAQDYEETCRLGPDDSISISHQEQMIKALTALGPQAAPAVPHLIRALATPKLRRQAAEALGQIGAAAHAPLLHLLRTPDADGDLRRAAAYALRRSSADLDALTAAALGDLALAAQEQQAEPQIAAMLAAALVAHGYAPPQALQESGVTGLPAHLCPSWPLFVDANFALGIKALAYDPYLDACTWEMKPTAPTWRQFVRWLGRVFRR